jgi:site-specific recombinase XerD
MLDPLAAVLAERGVQDLRAVSRGDIDAYAGQLARCGRYRTQTQRMMLRAVKRFFEYLVETSKLFASPAEHLRDPREKRLLGPVLDEAKVDKLLAAPNTSRPRGIRDRALLELLYATGLRRKEVCAPAVFDVDLDGGWYACGTARGTRSASYR